MLELKTVTTSQDLALLMPLVQEIWTEVFTPIIGEKQVTYMLNNYQSQANIQQEQANGAKYLLIYYQNKPIGYTAYEDTPEYIYLSKLYLHQSTRGQGLSSQVFDWYEQLAKGRKLHLNVNQGNNQAIAVYEHRGFKRVDERYVDIGEGYVMNDFIYEKQC
ncbi:GNAT family N-acetyltransferase [Enterococcus columbae]|uniref:N-acetyltransferase domain-containing protein n=1 Tax=Enterococcus columbae DSM 7374 = ATCC 51263 TaxID=1121865 RepID=S0KD04_9ENTE|nr:GNAT family N-acetyltransferase [Enterococcus columbae]EOT38058.1 hypothetical protein OMW_02315 [Enterococcus columbae DSM 7374 = ATCC 51263]EOW83725.1 hypothetical protein I568_01526 [Enterococcus columbae DSM 7374 = ATCC 51263]